MPIQKSKKAAILIRLKADVFLRNIQAAEQIAKQLETDFSGQILSVIVVGGDGTLHEVVNGLSESKYPVSFIAAGSGNDFARGHNIKGSATEIFRRIISGESQNPYWLGRYRRNEDPERSFVNSISFGYDGEIVKYLDGLEKRKWSFINQVCNCTNNCIVSF